MGSSDVPAVFISYSHDSPTHMDRVLALADRLRTDGVDCTIDQFESAPAEGWPRWMETQLATADFVLLVCTETYLRRVMLKEKPGFGHGTLWEANTIYNYLNDAGTINRRFIPILFADCKIEHIPMPLRGVNYYLVDTPKGYEDLLRRVFNRPSVNKRVLGTMPPLPPRNSTVKVSGASVTTSPSGFKPRASNTLSRDMWERSVTTLSKCDAVFESNVAVARLFVTQTLQPFRPGLPGANDVMGRVIACISYLVPLWTTGGESVFVLFLDVLRVRYPSADSLRTELDQLYDNVKREMER